ncbi:hypothetical protein C8R44DRAFT_741911 [Mycena epipterygia]|nr:hypothetical protein C8R44DRAFT_741911 [Mycena epipterygia]
MLYKLLSSALLFLALAQGAVSVPQGSPIELVCGGPYDAPCPSGQLCCGSITGVGNVSGGHPWGIAKSLTLYARRGFFPCWGRVYANGMIFIMGRVWLGIGSERCLNEGTCRQQVRNIISYQHFAIGLHFIIPGRIYLELNDSGAGHWERSEQGVKLLKIAWDRALKGADDFDFGDTIGGRDVGRAGIDVNNYSPRLIEIRRRVRWGNVESIMGGLVYYFAASQCQIRRKEHRVVILAKKPIPDGAGWRSIGSTSLKRQEDPQWRNESSYGGGFWSMDWTGDSRERRLKMWDCVVYTHERETKAHASQSADWYRSTVETKVSVQHFNLGIFKRRPSLSTRPVNFEVHSIVSSGYCPLVVATNCGGWR